MIGYRNIYKSNGVLMTFWSKSKKFDTTKFCIMCHGCPSHPFDHSPVWNQKLLEDWYVLVFPNYLWTWWSDWECTFDNSIHTIEIVIDFLLWGYGFNDRNSKVNTWSVSEINLIWASYWASVVLCVWANNDSINKIIACSPVPDWKLQNWLQETANFLNKSYNNLWRVTSHDLTRFVNWKINLNPSEHIIELSKKNILIIHDLYDPQIPFTGVEIFYKSINNNNSKLFTQNNARHILLHHLDEDEIYQTIITFLSK